jgi:hypothetical protein
MCKFSYFVVVIPLLLAMSTGCQASNPVPKAALAAGSVQDVIAAWDLYCDAFNFGPCPPDAGDEMTCTETMGDMYFGGNFAHDSELLMDAIGFEVLSTISPDPGIDDLLNSVLSSPLWFK